MTIQEPRIQDFMTLQPLAIEGKENIETARKMMSKFSIRHLPVLTDGIVSGILSERELNLATGIECVDPLRLLVIDACRALHELIEEAIEESNRENTRNFRFFLKSILRVHGKDA